MVLPLLSSRKKLREQTNAKTIAIFATISLDRVLTSEFSLECVTGVGCPIGVDGLDGGRLLELVHLAGLGLDAGQCDGYV